MIQVIKQPRPLPELTFTRVLEVASSHGGQVPNGNQRDDSKRMLFRCEAGHQWHAIPYSILKGSWCPHPACSGPRISKGRAAGTLERQYQRIRVIVTQRYGQWPQSSYKNNSTPINLICQNGHQFSIRPDVLFQGSWCQRCVGKVPAAERLAELQQIASERGGELLSKKYVPKARLQWSCAAGHTWWSSSGSVRDQRSWCPHCTRNAPLNEEYLADRISALARQQGGMLIGLERRNSGYRKRVWIANLRCAAGHEWEGRIDHLLNKHWCPTCNMPGTREKICRQILEHLLNDKFPKRRPSWLRTSKGRKAELDGYNEILKLALEYHGQQHYCHVPFFHSGNKSLAQRMEDDRLKREACNAEGVTLLEVSIIIPLEELHDYLDNLIRSLRPDLAAALNRDHFDVYSARTGRDEDLREMRKIAKSRSGRCVSSVYIDNSTKLEWECSLGHRWLAAGGSVKSGSWCPKCKGKRISERKRTSIEIVETLCKSISLQLHGTEDKENGHFYLVSCTKGHNWHTDISRLRDGRGCQKCAARKAGDRLKLTIEKLRVDAENRGGQLLSQRYLLSGTRLLWECGFGHRWLANANSIRRGSWCPVCTGKKNLAFRGSLEDFLRTEMEAQPGP